MKNCKKNKEIIRKICEVQSQTEYLSLEKIEAVLKENRHLLVSYAYCLHDQDKDEDGKPKKPHYHIFLKFKDGQPFSRVAKWFGLSERYVRIIASNYDAACAYLIHRGDSEKYQYDASAVVASFDYPAFLERLKEDEMQRVQSKSKFERLKKQILREVEEGSLRGYNFHERCNFMERIALRPLLDKAVAEVIKTKLFRNEERKLDVVYICGDSGAGKTSYAKMICEQRGLPYVVSGEDRDPLENYDGQPAVILDELRPSSMKLSSFLKLIDNNTESTAGARYHGKTLIECKLIVITSILAIDEFFQKLQESHEETAIQIRRRCKTMLYMKKDFVTVYQWDVAERRYEIVDAFENPITGKYSCEKSAEELKADARRVLGIKAETGVTKSTAFQLE